MFHAIGTFSRHSILVPALALLGSVFVEAGLLRADEKRPLPPISVLQTTGGIPFAVMGAKPAAPAPTLFVFGSDMNGSLMNADGNKIGHLLAPHGYLSVSLDLPCHGGDVRPGERASDLRGWKTRIEQGENIAAVFAKKVSQVLDFLIAEKYTDPTQVTVVGTSRGGFAALHCAAAEPRFKQVIAFAPVTHLPALTEFAGAEKNEAVLALSPIHVADKLVGRPLWIIIGNQDLRVSTDDCLALAREVIKLSVGKLDPIPVEMRLVGTIGHRLHASPTPAYGQICAPHDEAAAWLLAQRLKNN
jgi:dienelactone hydrolase